MSDSAIIYPVLVQVGLTLLLLFMMGWVRVRAIQGGELRIRDIALRQDAWPARVKQIANSFHNQLEIPVLFYTVVLLALFADKVDMLLVTLAWLFAFTRLGHAYIHVTSNNVLLRFRIFLIGAVVLTLMWVIAGFRIAVEGA